VARHLENGGINIKAAAKRIADAASGDAAWRNNGVWLKAAVVA